MLAVRRNKDRFFSRMTSRRMEAICANGRACTGRFRHCRMKCSVRIESWAACQDWGVLAALQARNQSGGCGTLPASKRSSDNVACRAKRGASLGWRKAMTAKR